MPSPRNVEYTRTWMAHQVAPLAAGGINQLIRQYGFKTLPGESKKQVLNYDSWRYYGSVEYLNPKYVGPYGYPASFNGAPYSGSGWGASGLSAYGMVGNRAYDKFKDKALGESTSIGTLLAERKEALGMITTRAAGLYRAYKQLRRGNFKQFLRALSVDPKRKHRSVVRSSASEASGLWLEYWFGWSPTVSDLYAAADVLNSTPNFDRFEAASGVILPPKVFTTGSGRNRYSITEEGRYIVKTGATVKCTDPTLQLLQQMGLINPLAIAWEVVPFSFVIDWFTKFGDVVSATTDFVGVEVTDGYTTRFLKTKGVHETWDTFSPKLVNRHRYKAIRMLRRKGLISPVTNTSLFLNYGESVTRAATAVSLLNQIFLAK